MAQHLKRSINLVFLKNGNYGETVAHLERQLELSGLENDRELPIPTLIVAVAKDNENQTDLSKTSSLYCKKLGHLIKDCRKKISWEQEPKQDPNQKLKNKAIPRHTLLVHNVKGPTIHQKNVAIVRRQPTEHKNLNNTYPAVTIKRASQRADLHKLTTINNEKPFKLTKPRLQWADVTTTRRYIISDPSNNFYEFQQTICNGDPSIVCLAATYGENKN